MKNPGSLPVSRLILYMCSACILICFAETAAFPVASLQFEPLPAADTINIKDSLVLADTLFEDDSDIDSVIYASSTDSLIFFTQDKMMHIYGKGKLKYKNTNLTSGTIFVDFETSFLEAFGAESDTAGGLTDTPVLNEEGTDYRGSKMKYNFKNRKGYITYAETEAENANYSGAKIKKVTKDVFFVENGFYTTCDADHPHYGFFCAQMKVIPDEQVIGKWIFLTFGGVPFPVPIPFAVFPLEKGRRSGIIAPAFGNRTGYGRYLSRFGYFWAPSDYFDLTLTGDFYTRGSFGVNSRFRYNKRYDFNGYVEGSYYNLISGESNDPGRASEQNWRLRWFHNQSLTPTSRFDANLEFLSSNFIRETSTNINELLKNDIYSNITYFETWEESGMSLTANYNRRQELQTGNIFETLPGVTFSKSLFYPFANPDAPEKLHWYEEIGVSYTGQLQNQRNNVNGIFDVRNGIQHQISLTAAPKIGFFNVSPSVSYQEIWYTKSILREAVLTGNQVNTPLWAELNKNRYFETNQAADTVITRDVDGFRAVRTFTLSLAAQTKVFGIFPVNNFGVSALRHTLIPRVSYNYQPDFSEDFWGYYGSYQLSSGETVKYSKFEKEIFGGPSTGEQQSLSFGVSNIFEIKTMKDLTDTTSKEQKIQLLNVNASMNYNFAADSLKFSNLFVDYRTQVSDFLNLAGSTTFGLYDYDQNGRDINKFLISEGKGFLRLKNVSFSASLNLSGERFKSEQKEDTIQTTGEEIFFRESNYYTGLYSPVEPDFTIPWSLSLSYNFNENRFNPNSIQKFSNVRGDFSLSLTKNWKFTLGGSYDIERKEFAAPQIVISRDLHCWVMNFVWNPVGTYTGYRFEIKVKAPQLSDLKLEKSDNFFSGRR
ncbi:MAG: LPS-assembly protein LptD [Ignavibacteriaceae bacterium]|nr:LPS-assembly protein LptD [Ignavibacteriaceae bacterium]